MTASNIHYEVTPSVFEVFLDRRMKYTSGLYLTDDMNLDEAQEAKLGFIAGLLRLRGGKSVLDIGAGWGSLTGYLAHDVGCRVTCVTPAQAQAGYIRERVPLAEIELGCFEDVDFGARTFDAIAMVGVIEHMPDHVAALRKVRGLLKPGGRFYLSASCYRSAAARAEYEPRPSSLHAVELYGYTAMPTLSTLVAAMEDAGLGVTSLTDLTAHYHRTISDWQQRIELGRERMDSIAPGFAGELSRYFETANASWGYTAKHYALTAVRSRMGETKLPL